MPRSRKRKSPFTISVVVPAYNEQGNVGAFTGKLIEVLQPHGGIEILWVDDGSRDDTLAVIKQIAAKDARVRYVSLSRNFGHQLALKAGVDFASGDCVVTLDADGEHPPELIPRMLELWKDGYDIVFTKRLETLQLPWGKRLSRSLFYRTMRLLSSVPIEHGAADFRLLDRDVVEASRGFSEKDLFWRGLVAWMGFKQAFFTYEQHHREWGASKYTLRRMLNLSVTGLTSFSTKPLYLGVFAGAVFALVAFVFGVYAVMIRIFTDQHVSGWASLLASFMFISGIQLVLMGIIGVYVGKVFDEVKDRPQYLVRDTNCLSEPKAAVKQYFEVS